MIGAIAGDIIGSAYECTGMKSTVFKLFDIDSVYTDDTVLTVAVADCILHGKEYGSTFVPPFHIRIITRAQNYRITTCKP